MNVPQADALSADADADAPFKPLTDRFEAFVVAVGIDNQIDRDSSKNLRWIET
ncbi:hypothetical protein [Paraburkholderia aromaticivorans]|uniref:hypothetical protein n=1 Tax=Paraburkholderia aromaticivorans TaxID=2026199 RepID=UPI0014562008|nr:hypothetical protein [Paraburkholderia aromaticivorans]